MEVEEVLRYNGGGFGDMVCGGTTVEPTRRSAWEWSKSAELSVCSEGLDILRAKGLPILAARDDDDDTSGCRFGCHLGGTTVLGRVLWVKTMSVEDERQPCQWCCALFGGVVSRDPTRLEALQFIGRGSNQ
jgi:hypothetical protein